MRKLTVATVCMIVLAACGDSTSSDTSAPTAATSPTTTETSPTTTETSPTNTTETSPTTTGPATPAGPPVATITIADFAFGEPITVSVGDTVEVVNSDRATHTWTATEGAFNVTLAGDATTTFTFDEAGEYAFFCSIHPSMTGSVTVEG